jgi:hypothetical protein
MATAAPHGRATLQAGSRARRPTLVHAPLVSPRLLLVYSQVRSSMLSPLAAA